jgi:glycerol-3-phosphate O-acyltransferase/dihydroxyacetone phosphate acyltransferase
MLTVKKVLSNHELLLETTSTLGGFTQSPADVMIKGVDYKIVPPVSHDEMFNAVYDHLGQGGALGIFPEGGSHDRTMLLPLKVGVCIMALGAMKKFPSCNVRLVPVGLNYFSQHRFNSRVLVKFGDPIEVDQEVKSDYLAGGERKREAVCNLLEKVQGALQEVTVCAPDWSMLKTFWTLRDLYTPSKRLLTMTSVEKVLLAQAFASDYNRVKEDSAVVPLLERINKYSRKLHALGLKDKANLESAMLMHSHSTLYLCCLLVLRCLRLLVLLVIFSPVYLKLMPVYLISTAYSLKKSKEAVAASSVKIIGKDVMGTYKLIIALPMLVVGHALITFALLCYFDSDTAAVAYYFFAPFAQFVVYKLMPNDLALVRSTYHLALAMVFKQDQTQLLDERNKLKEEARNLVDRLEWGFHSNHVTGFDRTQTIHFSGHFTNKDDSEIFQSLQDFELDLWGKSSFNKTD